MLFPGLTDFDFTFLFLGLWLDHLRNAYVKYSVLYFGLDLVSFGILRKKQSLTEFGAGELTTDVAFVLVLATFTFVAFLLLFCLFLLHLNYKISVFVDVNLEVFF